MPRVPIVVPSPVAHLVAVAGRVRSKMRRAIDLREEDGLDEKALKSLVQAAAELNAP